jgi:hypothetical protein
MNSYIHRVIYIFITSMNWNSWIMKYFFDISGLWSWNYWSTDYKENCKPIWLSPTIISFIELSPIELLPISYCLLVISLELYAYLINMFWRYCELNWNAIQLLLFIVYFHLSYRMFYIVEWYQQLLIFYLLYINC